MCGAFSILHPFKELGLPFNAGYNGPNLPPKYNARPGQNLPVIFNEKPGEIQIALWGIKPSWSKTMIINTRKESLNTKSFYKKAFQTQRCIIPADGFYEWAMIDGKKIPYYFRLKDKSIFGFAGIWMLDSQNKHKKFTIITTTPNNLVSKIHGRMPAILPKNLERQWLDKNLKADALLDMIPPFPKTKCKATRFPIW